MPRLFVAVDLPESRSERVAELRDAELNARWTPASQYHITLRFIGDVGAERTEALRESLRTIEAPPFSLAGGGLDVFPSRRRPRVLVVRIGPDPSLERLRNEVERVVVAQGLDPEPKPFHPHVTFGRLRRGSPRAVRRFLKANAGLSIEPFAVSSFHLYGSTLGSDGAEHTILESYPLRGNG